MARKHKNLLKISEIAREAGVLPSTVRYYTDMGLLNVSGETPGGHRLYERDFTLQAISKIQFLSQQGLTMEDIKRELDSTVGKKKILVIDDEPEVGNFVSELIKTHFPDFEVKIVYDGFTAGRILNEFLPDLIVLDLMLPGINGFDVCKQIRSSKYFSNIKILAVTGYDSAENKQKIISCGADDYLAKPMDLKILEEKIISLLQLKEKVGEGGLGLNVFKV
ncbi:MAG: response regulator [Elusimicrobiota bacterium]